MKIKSLMSIMSKRTDDSDSNITIPAIRPITPSPTADNSHLMQTPRNSETDSAVSQTENMRPVLVLRKNKKQLKCDKAIEVEKVEHLKQVQHIIVN